MPEAPAAAPDVARPRRRLPVVRVLLFALLLGVVAGAVVGVLSIPSVLDTVFDGVRSMF